MIEEIWRPDSFFKNAKAVTFQRMTIPNHYLWLYRSKKIMYMVKWVFLHNCFFPFLFALLIKKLRFSLAHFQFVPSFGFIGWIDSDAVRDESNKNCWWKLFLFMLVINTAPSRIFIEFVFLTVSITSTWSMSQCGQDGAFILSLFTRTENSLRIVMSYHNRISGWLSFSPAPWIFTSILTTSSFAKCRWKVVSIILSFSI